MSIVYICTTYDSYDPNTGLFNMIQDCIEWNTETQGTPPSTGYSTISECYEQSECMNGNHSPQNPSTNSCGINILSVTETNRTSNNITFNITLDEEYYDTQIEYALYDIENNLIQDFIPIPDTPNPLKENDDYILNIQSLDNIAGCCRSIYLSDWLVYYSPYTNNNSDPIFEFKNINGEYEYVGIGQYGYPMYRSKNSGLWSITDPFNYPDTYNYIPNITQYDPAVHGDFGVLDRWYVTVRAVGNILLCWGITYGQNCAINASDSFFNDDNKIDQTLTIDCKDLGYFNDTLTPCPNNISINSINITSQIFSSLIVSDIGTITSDIGSHSGSNPDICNVLFRLHKICPDGSESGSESGSKSSDILFDMSSWNQGQVPNDTKLLLNAASAAWSNRVAFDPDVADALRVNSNNTWNGIVLNNYIEDDFGPDFLAACGIVEAISLGDIKNNALSFDLYMNTYYYRNPANVDFPLSWKHVMIHELGHALGIGIFWNLIDSIWLDGNAYLLSQNGYNALVNVSRNKIPVEDSGNPGTIGAHWENNFRSANPLTEEPSYPGILDIMIGYASSLPITQVSTGYLLDLGYVPASTQITNSQSMAPTSSQLLASMESINKSIKCGQNCMCHHHQPMITKIYNPTNYTINNL